MIAVVTSRTKHAKILFFFMVLLPLTISCQSGEENSETGSEEAAGDNMDAKTSNRVSYNPGDKIDIKKPGKGKEAFPLITADAAKICNDITFYNQEGKIVKGTANCSGTNSSDDEDLLPENIKKGVRIGSVTGTLDSEVDDCIEAGQTGCLATSNFPAVPKDLLSNQPPPPLCGYNSRVTCEADFACAWNQNSCIVNPWNIRAGVSLAGVTGALKTSCRNTINGTIFNSDVMPPGNVATVQGTAYDWWDTIDDYNNNGDSLPAEKVTIWNQSYICDHNNWQDLTSDGSCDSANDDCMMRDLISGMVWSESFPTTAAAPSNGIKNWSEAVQHCENLTFGGRSDWRLPTQKELMAASIHGIRDVGFKGGTPRPNSKSTANNDFFVSDIDAWFWSSTTLSYNLTWAWGSDLVSGLNYFSGKSSGQRILCVSGQ